MVDETATVTVSVISSSGHPNPLPESEMDALLLGRTKVNHVTLKKVFIQLNAESFINKKSE